MVDYRKYKVWQKSHQLVIEVYAITSNFPKEEQFNLVHKLIGQPFQYQRISPKVVAEKPRKNSFVFYIFLQVLLMN